MAGVGHVEEYNSPPLPTSTLFKCSSSGSSGGRCSGWTRRTLRTSYTRGTCWSNWTSYSFLPFLTLEACVALNSFHAFCACFTFLANVSFFASFSSWTRRSHITLEASLSHVTFSSNYSLFPL